MAFEHEFVRNIQIAVQIESGLAVMKVGAGLAAVEEVERTGRRDIQPFGQLVRHTAYLMTKNHLLSGKRVKPMLAGMKVAELDDYKSVKRADVTKE